MSDKFAHLAQHSVSTEPRRFTVAYGTEAVTLHCLPAGEANKPYWNEVLRNVSKRTPGQNRVSASPELTKVNRIKDAKAFAKHCITGWDETDEPGKNPLKDSKGAVVPYSKEEAEEFLTALANHVPYAFDELRLWLVDDRNFTGDSDGGVELGN